jgi:hypothetical protein
MYTALNARTQSISSATVESEIALINLNILSAVQNGNVSATVNSNTHTTINGNVIVGTPMTVQPNYYYVWQTTVVNKVYDSQMASVIDNFTRLGYTISRKSTDGTHFYWTLNW